ncbi:TIGR03546 family protein [Rhodopirellula sp. MGV]|uniref:TIGR03546 family protein n=1 Tax=Rhodopirellula sp. MGV TaxID=2023130 RepID=UPI000B975A94|nr:TIGR03546 family protein [Rhodopirellula sp. MGV]OYP34041.1 hypothetical protein CGZ80_16650 [Rhodopirellula sp. MGV]PNY38331.1 DUF2062 domain-containing protein [Rhodopirellula baltica]
MVVFSLKLLNNLRKAIADRRFPRQLAAGCAFGVLLGIMPHGNLLAVVVLLAVLSFQINHALMAAVAIGISFIAPGLDDYSHQLGEYLLNHPKGHQIAVQAWTLPFVPWTNLNNTVVLGSFLIGVASVWPVYKITLPFFRWIAPAEEEEKQEADAENADSTDEAIAEDPNAEKQNTDQSHAVPPVSVRIDDSQASSRPPRWRKKSDRENDSATALAASGTVPVDSVLTSETEFVPATASKPNVTETATAEQLPDNEQLVSIETKIDVIRMKDYRDSDQPADPDTDQTTSNDEALNYLLQQLRYSQQRKAAG